MADEEKTAEQIAEEKAAETEALDSVIEEGDEKSTEEIAEAKAEKVEASMEKFDKALDSDDDDSAAEEKVDDGEEVVAKEEDSAKEEATKATSEEDSINAEADALEKDIEAELAKTDEQKADEKAEDEKKLADEAEAQAKKEAEDEEKPYDCGLSSDPDDEDSYEPALVEAMNKQGQATLDRAVVAEKANAVLTSKLDQQDAMRHADWMDRKFETLGENFDEVLGKGEFEDLEPGGTQRANRMAVSKRMGAVVQVYVKAKKPIPTRTKLFKMAVDKLFDKETKQPKTDKKTIAAAKKRAGQALGSGSKKGSAESAATSKAAKVKAFDDMIDE